MHQVETVHHCHAADPRSIGGREGEGLILIHFGITTYELQCQVHMSHKDNE
jgi:hypothetical protein